LEFDQHALEDLSWWVERDRKTAVRIFKILTEIQSDPFQGIGKPKPLRRDLKGCWSRRIDDKHRVVYEVFKDKIRILACRYHY